MKTLLRGGTVVDGTGAEGGRGDVLLEGSRILAVGEVARSEARGAAEVVCEGLVVAPGFIDVHTHYDAQIFWDPDLTPSSWHGVTTVVMGNCGFGIAPTRPEDRGTVARILENVEGMTLDALEAGIPWSFESFPSYVEAVSALPLRINAAAFVGHTPVRQYVMGDAATEREATESEVAAMAHVVGEAMDAGAIGFSTSHAASHVGAYGKPVPSRLAALSEIWALASELGTRQRGIVEATWGPDLFVEEFAELSKTIGRPVTWAAIMATHRDPDYADEVVRRTEAAGGLVQPQIAGRPIVVQMTLTDPGPFANVESFASVLALPRAERPARYRDTAWRAEAEAQINGAWGSIVDRGRVSESERHAALVGGDTLGVLAAERGTSAFSLMIDLALEEDLATRFHIPMTNDNEEQVGRLLGNDALLLGLSDAGAHTSQLCDADFATYLLGYWCRERGALSLEKAVWRLTGQPAELLGLAGRGRLAAGAVADITAFDPTQVGTAPLERLYDLPTGADRLVARSHGVEHVWVAGTAIRRNGSPVPGVSPGRFVSPASD